MKRLLVLLFAAVAACGGCTTNPLVAQRPARINHVVFVELQNPDEVPQLIADADLMLQRIPTVSSYYCGRPFESGRTNVSRDYSVGMYMGFMTPEDYTAYVAHPSHVEFVERWKPRCARLAIYDVLDETP